MKKIKLFLAACAAMVGVQSANAADTWTGNEPQAGSFYLYNVGADAFLDGGNSWGTQASLAEIGINCVLAASGTGYSISTNSNYANCYLGVNGFIDRPVAEACGWVFTAVNGLTNTYTINYNGTYLYWAGSGTALSVGTTVPTNSNGYFKLVSATDRYNMISQATKTSSVDVSYMLGNADFGRNSVSTMWQGTAPVTGGPNGDFVAEYFNKNFDTYQTITVPNGTYVASVYGYYRAGEFAAVDGNTQNAIFYVNSAETPLINIFAEAKTASTGGWAQTTDLGFIPNNTTNASDCFNAGGYADNKLYVTVTNGTMTIGLKKTTAITNDWTCFDKIRIRYYGDCSIADVLGLELGELIEEAQALVDADVLGISSELATAITTAQDVMTSGETEEDFATGKADLQSAIDAYNAKLTLVSRYVDVRAAALAIISNLDVTTSDANAVAATTATEVNAAVVTLRAAFQTALASIEIPADPGYIDVTSVLVDNATVRQNTNYWTIDGTQVGTDSFGKVSNEECEFYNQNFDFYQNLTLSKGTWEFGVTGFHRGGQGAFTTYFYAGDDKTLIPGVESSVVNSMAQAKTYFDNGNGKVALKFGLEQESNNLKIGIVNTDTQTDKWTIFRDFTLKYYGSAVDYSVYEDQWTALVAEANTAKTNNANVTGTELTALNAAIADSPAGSNVKATYLSKIEALQAALNTFNAAAPAYNAYVAYKDETIAVWGTDFNVDAPTTAAEASIAVQNLNVAQYNKVASDYNFSATGLIGDFGSWTGTATVAGEAAEPNYLTNEHWSGSTHAYYEQAASGWGNANGWTIKYEKKCTLPAGDYVIKVAARSSGDVTSLVSCSATSTTVTLPSEGAFTRGINTSGVASWSDDDTFARGGDDNQGYGWQWRFLPFSLTEQTEVTMTFYAETSKQYNWMSIADGELLSTTKLAQDVAYNEAGVNTIENTIIADVTMTREIKKGYNTVCLPFALTANQVNTAFGTGTEVYTFYENSESEQSVSLNFTKGDGSISANVPVLVKTTAASTEQVFNGVQVVAPTEDAKVVGKYVDYVGVYNPTTLANGDFFLATKDGVQQIFQSEGKNDTVKGFRAYFQKKTDAPVKAALFIDGVATAIEGINADANNDATIFNLAGQRVNKAQKGIYIVNGKKVIVK